MAGSWRDILDGANASPPMDRGGMRPGPVLHRPVSQAPQQRPQGHPYSAAEARGLLERELAAVSGRPLGDGPAPASGRRVEHRPPAAPVRPVDAGPAPAPGRRVEHRLPAAPVRPVDAGPAPASARPVEHRHAAVPVRPSDIRPVAPPYVTPAPAVPMEHTPAPATLTEYWLATGGRAPAAMAGNAPDTEEKIPYNSLMDALGRATPAMLTEAEKAGLPVPVPAIRSPKIAASPKRLPWRGLLAVSALVLTAGLSAYVLLSHGGKDAGASQAGRIASTADAGGDWVDIPLPARRPAAFRGHQSPARGEPGSAAN